MRRLRTFDRMRLDHTAAIRMRNDGCREDAKVEKLSWKGKLQYHDRAIKRDSFLHHSMIPYGFQPDAMLWAQCIK